MVCTSVVTPGITVTTGIDVVPTLDDVVPSPFPMLAQAIIESIIAARMISDTLIFTFESFFIMFSFVFIR